MMTLDQLGASRNTDKQEFANISQRLDSYFSVEIQKPIELLVIYNGMWSYNQGAKPNIVPVPFTLISLQSCALVIYIYISCQ